MFSGIEIFEAIPSRYETREGLFGPYQAVVEYQGGKILYNGKEDSMADALKEMYSTIMQKFWLYINTDEILNLKAKIFH